MHTVSPSLLALVGLTVSWLVVALASMAVFDLKTGFSPITLTFLIALGAFSVAEAVRYSRAMKKDRAKASRRPDREP